MNPLLRLPLSGLGLYDSGSEDEEESEAEERDGGENEDDDIDSDLELAETIKRKKKSFQEKQSMAIYEEEELGKLQGIIKIQKFY